MYSRSYRHKEVITMHILDTNLKKDWRKYVMQCLLVVVALIVILYFVDVLTHAAIVAALGASTFIVFAMPRWITARPRNVIGGHIIGLIAGSICYFCFIYPPLGLNDKFLYIFAAAVSVGLAMLLMVSTDTEHPPAAGTALGIVASGWSLSAALFVLSFAVVLSMVRYLLKPWLRELV